MTLGRLAVLIVVHCRHLAVAASAIVTFGGAIASKKERERFLDILSYADIEDLINLFATP